MNIRIKICGITNKEDALMCVESGADALGFVFYEKSPRFLSSDAAADIVKALPPFVTTVGVFVNQSHEAIMDVAHRVGLDCVQLHGDEGVEDCRALSALRPIKAFRIKDAEDLRGIEAYSGLVSALLLDTRVEGAYGGTGRGFDRHLALPVKQYGRVILSGGLTPDNVVEAVKMVEPYGVDVSTGVESKPGRKDPLKVRRFIENIKLYEATLLTEDKKGEPQR